MNAADRSPADGLAISVVNLSNHQSMGSMDVSAHMYVAQAVRPEKAGATMTQTFRMSTGILMKRSAFQISPEVTMRPGYMVPPTTRPSGYHAVGSNQFQNSWDRPSTSHSHDRVRHT